MLSEEIVKTQFVVGILRRDVENIYQAQRLIARRNIYISGKELKKTQVRGKRIGVATGRMLRSLDNPNYVIGSNANGFIVSSEIVLHMRFLDMKKHGNRKIYNRQLWGILYNNTLPDIKYKYGSEVRDRVGDALREAFDADKK